MLTYFTEISRRLFESNDPDGIMTGHLLSKKCDWNLRKLIQMIQSNENIESILHVDILEEDW